MLDSFRAGACDIQIRTRGDLRELGKRRHAVEIGVADRPATDNADP
jgi:hypothetical protein